MGHNVLRLEVGKISINLRSLKLGRIQKMCIVLWCLINLEKHCDAIQNVKIRGMWYESLHVREAQLSRGLWKKSGLLFFSAPFLSRLNPMLQYLCWSCSRAKVVIFFPSFPLKNLASGCISFLSPPEGVQTARRTIQLGAPDSTHLSQVSVPSSCSQN